jgi:hypothetical protein
MAWLQRMEGWQWNIDASNVSHFGWGWLVWMLSSERFVWYFYFFCEIGWSLWSRWRCSFSPRIANIEDQPRDVVIGGCLLIFYRSLGWLKTLEKDDWRQNNLSSQEVLDWETVSISKENYRHFVRTISVLASQYSVEIICIWPCLTILIATAWFHRINLLIQTRWLSCQFKRHSLHRFAFTNSSNSVIYQLYDIDT